MDRAHSSNGTPDRQPPRPPTLAALLARVAVARWLAPVTALALAQWLALPAAAWLLGARGPVPWWLPLGLGFGLRFARAPLARATARRARPRVARLVAAAALARGDAGDAGLAGSRDGGAAFMAAFLLNRVAEAALPALVAGVLAAGATVALAAAAGDARAVAVCVVAAGAALAVRFAARSAAARDLDAVVAARVAAGQWFGAAERCHHEVRGAARPAFLDAVAAAAGRWAAAEGAHGATLERAHLAQAAVAVALAGAGLAALGIDTARAFGGDPALARTWLVLATAVAPGLAAAHAVDEIVHARRSLAALAAPEPAGVAAARPFPAGARAVVLAGVTVRFGARTALAGATLEVPLTGVTAVVGPNGAGKTTLAHVLAGQRAPAEGTCAVGGVALAEVDPDAVALVPQQPCLIESLTVAENARLVAPGASDGEVTAALRALGLTVAAGHPAAALSRGEQRRIAIARAVLKAPRLLVLDEPDAWLDRAGRAALRAALEREGTQRAVVLVTHRADLVRWVERVVVVAADHTIEAVGTPAEVAAASPTFAALLTDAADEALRVGAEG